LAIFKDELINNWKNILINTITTVGTLETRITELTFNMPTYFSATHKYFVFQVVFYNIKHLDSKSLNLFDIFIKFYFFYKINKLVSGAKILTQN